MCPASPFSCLSRAVFQCPLCKSGTSCWWPATGPRTLGGRDAYRATACRERRSIWLGWGWSRGPRRPRNQHLGLLQTRGNNNIGATAFPSHASSHRVVGQDSVLLKPFIKLDTLLNWVVPFINYPGCCFLTLQNYWVILLRFFSVVSHLQLGGSPLLLCGCLVCPRVSGFFSPTSPLSFLCSTSQDRGNLNHKDPQIRAFLDG